MGKHQSSKSRKSSSSGSSSSGAKRSTPSKPTRISNQKFRQQSATQSRSFKLKSQPTRSNQNSCHKIPNALLGNSYNKTSHQNVRKDIMGFGHSSSNIIYSTKNAKHSRMERDLSSADYRSSSVNQKGGSMKTALSKLKKQQNSSATTHVMREMRNSGEGYNDVVSRLDKRKFNSASEKKQIDMARRDQKKFESSYYY